MANMTRTRYPTAARAFLAVAAVATLGGCAMKSDIRDLQAEIRTLTVRQDSLITELREATASTQDTLSNQAGQLFDFRGEITRLLRETRDEIAQIRALTGENQRRIVGIGDQLANQRVVSGGGGAAGARPGDTDEGAGVSEELPGVVSGSDAAELWQTATQQLARGSLNTAERAFEQFLDEFPNHDRAADAYFFLADILEQQGESEEALEGFREVQERFPGSARVPDALYRIALLQIEAGDVDEARQTLERIVNTYPETAIALIARDKLDEIG
ncbi:MAG: tetratricopeptide repeat protein [Gemmatimonadota bacterium]|nr:tetratricopeptide repeat protein [Gemmatimonadota bacterium]